LDFLCFEFIKTLQVKNGSAASKPILKAAAIESMDSSLFVCFETLPFPFIWHHLKGKTREEGVRRRNKSLRTKAGLKGARRKKSRQKASKGSIFSSCLHFCFCRGRFLCCMKAIYFSVTDTTILIY